MAGSSPIRSSPLRRSQYWTSPDRKRFSDFLSDDRNSELSHLEALAAAQIEHQRVRDAALRCIEEHEHRLALLRLDEQEHEILEKQRREKERLQKEQRIRAEQEQVRALQAQSVPKLSAPPVQPPSIPLSASPIVDAKSDPNGAKAPTTKSSPIEISKVPAVRSPPVTQVNGRADGKAPAITSPLQPTRASPFAQSTTPLTSPFAKLSTTPAVNGPAATSLAPTAQKSEPYVEIHKNLKKLREYMAEQAKTNIDLKRRMGDMRRELRKCVGQLVGTGEKNANKQQREKIAGLLLQALKGEPPSAMIDPSVYILDTRDPVEGALHNEPQLPSLFIYLLNHLSKAVINQFIMECGASPKNADPLGIIVAQVFSNKDFQWRGKPLIDILMAKFRIVCPVLFGHRGSEKTEQGRARLGWKKEKGGTWISEQQHTNNMMGLGVGYASISLRDFSKSTNANPWPPSNYWTAMARIVNTPPAEISNTQCVVLRAMLTLHEEKFINFYGSAAIAALRKALVEFPAKAQDKTLPGVGGLQVQAQIYKRDTGLDLH